jgi:hypothetical protein
MGLSISNKGQIWGVDLAIAISLFFVGIIFLYSYILYSGGGNTQLDELLQEGENAVDMVLSEDIGILSEGRINQTKLDEFYSLDYNMMKSDLSLNNDFYFSFEDMKILGESVDYVGKINTTSISDLVKITRISVYDNKIIKFDFFIWK